MMTAKDEHYLRLQFQLAVHKKQGKEFQTLFESVMERAYPDFKRVRPYGSDGDGGNDGFRPSAGIYYQVYAPRDPTDKERAAAKKLKDDFAKVKTSWDQIERIQEYLFVFNERGEGATRILYSALAELKTENPEIKFDIFASKQLEDVFLRLKDRDFLALGFDVDSTKAISIARRYMDNVEIDLDNESGADAQKELERLRAIISSLADRGLDLDFEILLARAMVKLEKVAEAK